MIHVCQLGIFSYTDGDRYEGEYKNDVMSGKG